DRLPPNLPPKFDQKPPPGRPPKTRNDFTAIVDIASAADVSDSATTRKGLTRFRSVHHPW
ncbi:hypothetical protein TELCIR_17961, partial [Teladorsagia circumcincta]